MSTVMQLVSKSVISLHRKTGKEWLLLNEIFIEVNKARKVKLAKVKDILDNHSSLSHLFSGTKEYILKEKDSELYQSCYYERLKMVDNLVIGEIFSRLELKSLFKISSQSGIMKTNTLDCLVLITSENNGVYADSLIENGKILYTGEGQAGNQTLTRNNKTLYESKMNDLPVYLFSKDINKKYVFEGQVELYDQPYQLSEKDINGVTRLVWKFPLKIIYPSDNGYCIDKKYEKLIQEITKLENSPALSDLIVSEELIFKEGKVNIKKYRKPNKQIKRHKKPDYIANEIVKTTQGIRNEKDVYNNEIKRLMKENALEQVKKMQDFFKNKKDNEGFDILTFELNEEGKYIEKFIEVKSTKGNESTPIDISAEEIDFAKKHINDYYLYRIVKSDSKERYCKIVKGKDLLNDKDYSFVPSAFKIYSK